MANFKPEYTRSLVEKKPRKNPKTAKELADESKKRAEKIKQDFEDKINLFKDSAELSARKPPIKQKVGESDGDFRKRQKLDDNETPESPKRMSLGGAAKQHAKNKLKEQTDRAKNYGKQQAGKAAQAVLKSNPKLTKMVANASERSKAIQEKIAKIKNNNFSKRLKMLRDKYNAKKLIKKKIEDEAKKLALKIAQAMARFIIQIAISVLSALSAILIKLFIVVLIIVIIIAAADYACSYNIITESFCSTVIGVL